MKKHLFAVALAISLLSGATSCNSSATTEANTPAVVDPGQHGMASDSTATNAQQMAYICPMECPGSASMEPGKCPVCGMDLEKNPNYTTSADNTNGQ